MNGLRIVEAKINGQSFPISLPLLNYNPNNYITVVIGNNATGKSRLLTNMLNRLRHKANSRLRGTQGNVDLVIHTNGDLISTADGNAHILEDINLISISNSLFDKFPFEANSDINYSYIGARQERFGSHKRAIIHDLMDVLSENLIDITFRQKANTLFSFLQLIPKISINLKINNFSNKRFFELLDASISIEGLIRHLDSLSKQSFYRYQSKKIKKLILDEVFLNGFQKYLINDLHHLVNSKNRELLYYEIDLLHGSHNGEFLEEYKYFSLLRSLSIVTYDQITLYKVDGNKYDITDSSTGEIGLLMTFIRAIPQLKPNSIIFIDEPEISLHPSWQMQYIELLFKFLEGYTGCHVIIATHSHLLLSDLKNEWSSVLTLQRDEDNRVVAELRDYTPFGWSPEAILYDVFGVATVRNQLFEFELSKLLELIAFDSDDTVEIQNYIDKFESFKYTEADPLNLIIQEAKEYVASKQ